MTPSAREVAERIYGVHIGETSLRAAFVAGWEAREQQPIDPQPCMHDAPCKCGETRPRVPILPYPPGHSRSVCSPALVQAALNHDKPQREDLTFGSEGFPVHTQAKRPDGKGGFIPVDVSPVSEERENA